MATFYVRESGDNDNPGTSSGLAWRTLARASSHTWISGDVLDVGDGTGYGLFIPTSFFGEIDSFTMRGSFSGEGIGGASFPLDMKGIRLFEVKTIEGGGVVIADGERAVVLGNWFRGSFTALSCVRTVIENNFFEEYAQSIVSLSTGVEGSLTFQHNTLYSNTLLGKEAMLHIYAEPDTEPYPPYVRVFNNAFFRGATDPTLIVKYTVPNWAYWDMMYFQEGNWYEYAEGSGPFGQLLTEPLVYSNTYEDFQEWVMGYVVWAGRDVLGGLGEFHLGENPDDPELYALGHSSVLINRALEPYHDYPYDITIIHPRPALGKSDVGCYEVWQDIDMYTTYGFTSKLYTDVSDSAVPTQCVLFMDYLLDFPDCIRFKASFNGGSTWLTILDTFLGTDYLGEAFPIPAVDRGNDLQVKVEILIHDDNICKADVGTPTRVDLEYFSEAHLTKKIKKGSEVDIYDAEFNFIQRVVPGEGDQFSLFIPPGTYNLKVSGGGRPGGWEQVDVGHGTWFGRYSEQPADIWHQFHKAKAYTAFNGVQWASYMIWEQFKDQSKREGGEPAGCPPNPTGDSYWPNVLQVRAGKAIKNRSGVDQFFLLFDPTLFPELEGG